jgi:hypothetical protein
MRPRERRETGEQELFRSRLDQIIDMNHALVELARAIDWHFLEETFGAVYTDKPGQPPLSRLAHLAERNRRSRAFNEVRRKTARGRFFVGEPVAMRRPAKVPLDRMKFPLTLAGGLRTAFANVVSTPLPRRRAALVRRLKADRDERSGEPIHGASATEPSSRIDRRARR